MTSPPSLSSELAWAKRDIPRLANLPLTYPVFNWDDPPVKEGLHNRHMVGLTTWHTFFARTCLTLHSKPGLFIGYGLVGQGKAVLKNSWALPSRPQSICSPAFANPLG